MDLKRVFHIAVSGPESSGKSTLCAQLSSLTDWPWVAEAARYHPIALTRSGQGSFDEIGQIWSQQIRWNQAAERFASRHGALGVFTDTWSLVPEVWTLHAHGEERIDTQSWHTNVDAYVLCAPTLPWTPDPLRSIPDSAERWELFWEYYRRMEATGVPFLVYSTSEHAELTALNPAIKKGTPEACLSTLSKWMGNLPASI